jgi:integrase/recombinase XerD
VELIKLIPEKQIEKIKASLKRDKLFYGFLYNFKSENTRNAYERDLVQFFLFLKYVAKIKLSEVSHSDVVLYVGYIKKYGGQRGKTASKQTVNRKIVTLFKFFEYLRKNKAISKNPVKDIDRFKVEKVTKTEALTREEVKLLLSCTGDKTLSEAHHRAILYVLFTTGMRVTELCELKVKSLEKNGSNIVFKYMAKGQKEMIKILSRECFEAILVYLDRCRENRVVKKDESYLFTSPKKVNDEYSVKKMERKSITYILNKYSRESGIEKEITPHVARTTVTTELLSNNWDIYKVKEYMGWNSLTMAEAYDKARNKREIKVDGSLDWLS